MMKIFFDVIYSTIGIIFYHIFLLRSSADQVCGIAATLYLIIAISAMIQLILDVYSQWRSIAWTTISAMLAIIFLNITL